MAYPKTVSVPSSFSLAAFNQVVQQQEQVLGQLVLLGNDGSSNLLSFDMDKDPPAKPVTIQAATDAEPPGTQKVITGVCFIQGQLTDVIGIRAI
ncbi:MAG TPA: hypothetical protein VII56_08085 [Rhizomicrobium sp.]